MPPRNRTFPSEVDRTLVALTTNPGATMSHQRRAAVLDGTGPVDRSMTYQVAARELGAFYEANLMGAALRRIAALKTLSALLGLDGVLQVEACPFHSPSLPKKTALLDAIAVDGMLIHYVDHLRTFLRSRPVVIVSAVSSRLSLSGGKATLTPWIAWKAHVAGLATDRAEFVPLVTKDAATTAAALVSFENRTPKALVLMMGGNHLPGEKGLWALANAMDSNSLDKP
jgi:hypothetical protein